jgi:hypothetical protein
MKPCELHAEHRTVFLGYYATALAIAGAINPHELQPLPKDETQRIFLVLRRLWVSAGRCTCAIGEMTKT